MAPAVAHIVGAGEVEQKRGVLLRFTALASWTIFLTSAGFASLNHAFVKLWVGERFFAGATVNSVLVANSVMLAIVGTMSVLTFALGNIKNSTLISGFQSIFSPQTWLAFGIAVVAVVGAFAGVLGAISATFRKEIKAASLAAGISGSKYLGWYNGSS